MKLEIEICGKLEMYAFAAIEPINKLLKHFAGHNPFAEIDSFQYCTINTTPEMRLENLSSFAFLLVQMSIQIT